MKKVGRRFMISFFAFFGIAASLIGWITFTAGVTHIEFDNKTGGTVRYRVVEKSSGWSKTSVLQSEERAEMILKPKKAGILEVKIEGEGIAIEDYLYIEKAIEVTFIGSIEADEILWKTK